MIARLFDAIAHAIHRIGNALGYERVTVPVLGKDGHGYGYQWRRR